MRYYSFVSFFLFFWSFFYPSYLSIILLSSLTFFLLSFFPATCFRSFIFISIFLSFSSYFFLLVPLLFSRFYFVFLPQCLRHVSAGVEASRSVWCLPFRSWNLFYCIVWQFLQVRLREPAIQDVRLAIFERISVRLPVCLDAVPTWLKPMKHIITVQEDNSRWRL